MVLRLHTLFKNPSPSLGKLLARNPRNTTFMLHSFSTKSIPLPKAEYPHFEVRQTRFNDMDIFGHLNNTIYYNLMDDAINVHLITRGIDEKFPRYIVENGMQFYKPIAFPNTVVVGIQVVKLSNKAATYDVGFYPVNLQEDPGLEPVLAARGKFVHVYVDGETGRPVEIPTEARQILETLLVKPEED